ncbi:DUF429 domain-containing protein [Halomicroarcula sp. GCM10025324]|uniref:DUF429 domain-containing protein n=1 Tax=Haloarcula TaxID=2237 RepID=UPI0023E82974|nr:DUF429 domain-containing protein [Halomicroarcula sp. ZS-22-S1]
MGSGVLGVDFSGARRAGDALWVTVARETSTGLVVEDCYRATAKWGRDRESAHAGLVDRITDEDVATAGLDFPFSLPQRLLEDVGDGEWRGFLEWVAGGDGPTDSASFSTACRDRAEGLTGSRDVRRETDLQRAALCPYTNRVRSMTYHGARNVLGRLAPREDTAVVPMQADDAETVVCEVYPAATFGWLGCYREGYKGDDGARDRRAKNIETIAACSVDVGEHRETYLGNHDALDSLAAAVSAARVCDGSRPEPMGPAAEGHIYV